MRARHPRHHRIGRQGGWVGLIVILLAMVIVAWLAKDALKEYGLLADVEKQHKSTAGSVRGPGVGVTGAGPDATTVVPAPINALEKARGVQDMVREQADEQSRRIDAGTR
jgi:hypothetical protein